MVGERGELNFRLEHLCELGFIITTCHLLDSVEKDWKRSKKKNFLLSASSRRVFAGTSLFQPINAELWGRNSNSAAENYKRSTEKPLTKLENQTTGRSHTKSSKIRERLKIHLEQQRNIKIRTNCLFFDCSLRSENVLEMNLRLCTSWTEPTTCYSL